MQHTGISQFRTISLLIVEYKIFSVLSERMTTYMIENGYLNTSIQEGGSSGFAGCLEQMGVLSQMIYEARVEKSNLTVVWLDVANTCGSIPHNLIRTALKHYHIPDYIKGMISSYVGGIKLRFKTKDYIMQWQQLKKGIVLGCTVPVSRPLTSSSQQQKR